MALDKLRYLLTEHIERLFLSTYENFKLLIHPSVSHYQDLLNRVLDDIRLMPEIEKTSDNIDIKFYEFNYDEKVYTKDELLAFIFGFINQDWDIIKGIDISTGKVHFWLKNNNVVFDPSLAIISREGIYSKRFKQLKEIKNKDIYNYLSEHNNIYKFYHDGVFKSFNIKKNPSFSIDFVNRILEEFNKNIDKQYVLDDTRIEKLKQTLMLNSFIKFRQVLTKKRVSYLQSNRIAIHPSIDESILEVIEKAANNIYDIMKQEYNMYIDYHNGTLGNCYALSILFNLYDGDFKLVQGFIPHCEDSFIESSVHFYQHSWLEKDDIVYDPALRIITPKKLYYIFVQKQDEYSKEETENILKRIGFNLTHFRDFMNGVQIGNDETIRYRYLVNKIDSPEMKEEGEKLIALVKTLKR